MRSSKSRRKTSRVASAVWHVAPSCLNQILPISFNFCEQKFVQHGPITIAIDWNGLSLLIFEEKLPNYASGPKSAPNSDSFWVRRLSMYVCGFFVPQMRQFCLWAKVSFIWKDDFFMAKSASSVSRSQAHFQRCSSVYTTIFVQRKDKSN